MYIRVKWFLIIFYKTRILILHFEMLLLNLNMKTAVLHRAKFPDFLENEKNNDH